MNSNQKPELTRIGKGKRQNFGSYILCEERTLFTVEMKQVPSSQHDALVSLAGQIAEIVQQARSQVRQSVNQAMVASYWEIGRLIVEHEQEGQA